MYRLDPASPLILNDGFHSHNAMDERTLICAMGAEQVVDRKQAQTELKEGGTYTFLPRHCLSYRESFLTVVRRKYQT